MTIGADFCTKLIEVRGCRIKLEMWDTSGSSRLRTNIALLSHMTIGGLLVFDITNRESFANLSMWLEEAQRQHAGPHKPVFILAGNKADQAIHRKVSKEEALSFAIQHDMDYCEISAMNGSDIEKVFHKLADKILTIVNGRCSTSTLIYTMLL